MNLVYFIARTLDMKNKNLDSSFLCLGRINASNFECFPVTRAKPLPFSKIALYAAKFQKDFTVQKEIETTLRLARNKAPGPDNIQNEHLQQALVLVFHWAALFNNCLHIGARQCITSLLPKSYCVLTTHCRPPSSHTESSSFRQDDYVRRRLSAL